MSLVGVLEIQTSFLILMHFSCNNRVNYSNQVFNTTYVKVCCKTDTS